MRMFRPASPAAHETGFPMNVLKWSQSSSALSTLSETAMAPSGCPAPRAFTIDIMSGSSPATMYMWNAREDIE
jgi:hypothetical protein